jgi:hypothetical protein
VPETGTPSGKFFRDDGDWAEIPSGGAEPAGSGTEIQYRDGSALGAIPNSSVDGATGAVTLARLIAAANGAASTPPMGLTGTWFTGGTATTTKPAFLLEPAGTTSTSWSTSGTGLGVNAASGFAGNLLDLQTNGSSNFSVTSTAIAGSFTSITGSNNGFQISSRPTAGNGFTLRWDGGLRLGASNNIGYGNTPNTQDLFIERDAADTLAQRRTTNAQIFRVYNTFTSATNFERAKLQWDTNVLKVGTEKGSAGGTARDMELQTDGVTRITLKADGAILFLGIPASNPNVAGQLWNDGGTLKISAG